MLFYFFIPSSWYPKLQKVNLIYPVDFSLQYIISSEIESLILNYQLNLKNLFYSA